MENKNSQSNKSSIKKNSNAFSLSSLNTILNCTEPQTVNSHHVDLRNVLNTNHDFK